VKMKKTLPMALLGLILLQATAASLAGMPAFGRKYGLSCKTCHAPFPRLKPYGEEFAGNGFVVEDKESPRYFQDTGDDLLSLIRDIPIALRLDGFTAFNNAATGRFDFNTPYVLKLLSGGSCSRTSRITSISSSASGGTWPASRTPSSCSTTCWGRACP